MVIDIVVLDYANAKVHMMMCGVPDDYTNETIERFLESCGYNMATTSYMTAINIELLDERNNANG